jgi:hypothetical protein
MGKKITSLGVRLVGASSAQVGDQGIYIGRQKRDGPSNRVLLHVGDHVVSGL